MTNRLLKQKFGANVRGLGFFSFLVRQSFIQDIYGHHLFIEKELAGSYYLNYLGEWNEPETHQFLAGVFEAYRDCVFIDVGANIGEMTIQAYDHPHVQIVYVIEPVQACHEAIKKSIAANKKPLKPVILHHCFLGDKVKKTHVNTNTTNTRNVSLFNEAHQEYEAVMVETLDHMIPDRHDAPTILKIDTEGAEFLVLKGATKYISLNRPIIIFEYNANSRKHFTLADILETLPQDYEIWRLRPDGYLDKDYLETWNCVAADQAFAKTAQENEWIL